MQTEIFILCEKFQTSPNAQGLPVLTITAPFDTVEFAAFPAQLSFVVLASMRFFAEEHGVHNVKINLVDADLKPVINPKTKKPVSVSKTFTSPDNNRPYCQFEIWASGAAQGLQMRGGDWVEKPGEYFFELIVDGKNTARLPIHILLVPSY